jgi:hypothetical protein
LKFVFTLGVEAQGLLVLLGEAIFFAEVFIGLAVGEIFFELLLQLLHGI